MDDQWDILRHGVTPFLASGSMVSVVPSSAGTNPFTFTGILTEYILKKVELMACIGWPADHISARNPLHSQYNYGHVAVYIKLHVHPLTSHGLYI